MAPFFVPRGVHVASQQQPGYLLAGKASELERLQLQSRVWEHAGRDVLSSLPPGEGKRGPEGYLVKLSDVSEAGL